MCMPCKAFCTIWVSEPEWEADALVVSSQTLRQTEVPKSMMEAMRSSVFLLGSLLARCGEAKIHQPGGCRIGSRPIDMHLDGLRQLGFSVEEADGAVTCRGSCRGGEITLPYPSVGATENLMMAALAGKGDTILRNCAAEPEIADLAAFLRTCGFTVYGGGTDTIFVKGCRGASARAAAERAGARNDLFHRGGPYRGGDLPDGGAGDRRTPPADQRAGRTAAGGADGAAAHGR